VQTASFFRGRGKVEKVLVNAVDIIHVLPLVGQGLLIIHAL
jgi:hypothetical protein